MMTLTFLNAFLTKQYSENELFEVEARECNGEIFLFVEFEPTYERLKFPVTLKDTLDNILREVDRMIDMIYIDYKQQQENNNGLL